MTRAAAAVPAAEAGSYRERLLEGMAAAIRERGVGATTVADVVRHARTSRRTFYQHFEDRDACFLALCDAVTAAELELIAEAASAEGAWVERIDRTLATWLASAAADPALVRACLIDLPGVGPEGVARSRAYVERVAELLSRLVDEACATDPTLRPLPREAGIVVAGGLRELLFSALEEGRDLTELQAVAGELLRRLTMRG